MTRRLSAVVEFSVGERPQPEAERRAVPSAGSSRRDCRLAGGAGGDDGAAGAGADGVVAGSPRGDDWVPAQSRAAGTATPPAAGAAGVAAAATDDGSTRPCATPRRPVRTAASSAPCSSGTATRWRALRPPPGRWTRKQKGSSIKSTFCSFRYVQLCIQVVAIY